MTKVFFNQNIVSPYRLPLFQELNQDHEVDVWFHRKTSEDREWEAELEKYNFDYRVLNGKRIGPLTLNPGFSLRLLKEKYDIYFINENPATFLQSFIILIIAKLKRKPVVIWSETIDTERSRELPESFLKKIPVKTWRGFKKIYRKILFRFSESFVAFSEMAKEFLVDRGVPEKKIHTQIQFMPREILPEPENHDLKEKYSGKKMILSLGYLEERKGVQDLIEALRKVEDEDYRLFIAGTGPYEEELREKASGDDRIEFLGYLSEQQKANYFDAADLFVLPTHHDPWGLVINEALYYRTHVITTEAAGAKQIVDGGMVYPTGSTEALKQKILQQNEFREEVKSIDTKLGIEGIETTLEELTNENE
jgi:glycosyltransferase involved in cell wall biosynthesis